MGPCPSVGRSGFGSLPVWSWASQPSAWKTTEVKSPLIIAARDNLRQIKHLLNGGRRWITICENIRRTSANLRVFLQSFFRRRLVPITSVQKQMSVIFGEIREAHLLLHPEKIEMAITLDSLWATRRCTMRHCKRRSRITLSSRSRVCTTACERANAREFFRLAFMVVVEMAMAVSDVILVIAWHRLAH